MPVQEVCLVAIRCDVGARVVEGWNSIFLFLGGLDIAEEAFNSHGVILRGCLTEVANDVMYIVFVGSPNSTGSVVALYAIPFPCSE